MTAALTTLPWVEPATIQTDSKKRQVKFAVKEGAKFDLDEVIRVLGSRYGYGAKLLAGPTERSASSGK